MEKSARETEESKKLRAELEEREAQVKKETLAGGSVHEVEI